MMREVEEEMKQRDDTERKKSPYSKLIYTTQ